MTKCKQGKLKLELERKCPYSQEPYQTKHIMKNKFSTIASGAERKCIESANKINASFTLVRRSLWNTKKWFNILSEGCREIAAYKKATAANDKL